MSNESGAQGVDFSIFEIVEAGRNSIISIGLQCYDSVIVLADIYYIHTHLLYDMIVTIGYN